jgi:tryptophanyl-tRNA synthetase
MNKKRILTGDRPSGKLHLGHYVGSLKNRVLLQNDMEQLIILADLQALTDKANRKNILQENIKEIVLDYLSVGINPEKSTIFIQSRIPELAELTMFFLNLVTVSRLMRNPTIKTEIKMRGFEESIPAGFLMYPVSQAADILLFKPNVIPVGEDQLPMIEQTNEIARTFNRTYDVPLFKDVEALIPPVGRLVGIDGKEKMSKSLNNTIFLSDTKEEVTQKVMKMYTDPEHIKIDMPGKVEGNTVFMYLDIFDEDKTEIKNLKEMYQKGGLGDVTLKKRLIQVLNNFLDPIRERRQQFENKRHLIQDILEAGNQKTLTIAKKTMAEVKDAMGILYFPK